MKCQNIFPGKIRKILSICRLLKYNVAEIMVKF